MPCSVVISSRYLVGSIHARYNNNYGMLINYWIAAKEHDLTKDLDPIIFNLDSYPSTLLIQQERVGIFKLFFIFHLAMF